jgi:hypothetical protein
MNSKNDILTEHYAPLLEGTYDCIDRIVLNAYCRMLLVPGGVRNWYRLMQGSDTDMSDAAMMRFAGRFSRRVQSFCKKKGIPFVHFRTGERKHEEAEMMKPKDKSFIGIFAIFVSRAPSLLWEVKKFENGSIDIRRKEKTSLVNHYYIHIMDKDWGHITIRMCAHPPFSCNIILNGHEWVERHEAYPGLGATKQGNCFTSYNNGEKLTQIADTLKFNGQLGQVCQRWVYSCLWFVMDKKQQEATGFCYNYSIYQIEYSRNLLFARGRQMDAVYQKIIDLTRGRLDIKRLKTIFGKKRRPYNHKSTASAPEVHIETPDYNLTIFKIHFGRLTVKLYDKGERTLRAEVVVHNAKDLKCKRGIGSFSEIVEKLETIMGSFLSSIDYAHVATIDDGAFEELTMPVQSGKKRLAGIDFNKKRIKQVAIVLLCLSIKPGGFTSMDLSNIVNGRLKTGYSKRNALYDIKKFRGKGIVKKIPNSIRYMVTDNGISTLSAILCLLTKEIPAITSVVNSPWINCEKENLLEIDKHFLKVQQETEWIRRFYGIKIAA